MDPVAGMELMVHWGQLAGEGRKREKVPGARMVKMVRGVRWASMVRMAALGPCLGMGYRVP